MDPLEQLLHNRHSALAHTQVEQFLTGGVQAAVSVAPGPEKTSTSTGRTRASIHPAVNEPNESDPGVRTTYPIPDQKDVDIEVAKWRAYQPAYVSVFTEYYKYIQDRYPVGPTAVIGSHAALRAGHQQATKKAQNVRA